VLIFEEAASPGPKWNRCHLKAKESFQGTEYCHPVNAANLFLLESVYRKTTHGTMKKITLIILAFLAFACTDETTNEKSAKISDEQVNPNVVGSWLCVETGYSPGDKYHIVPVPANPPQTITFKDDFTMSSTNMSLEKFKYYRILQDTLIDMDVIAFLEEDPGMKTLNLADLNPTYNTSWDGSDLYLNFRWCTEGCHLKFKRIESPE
jgi:hypothetical protein